MELVCLAFRETRALRLLCEVKVVLGVRLIPTLKTVLPEGLLAHAVQEDLDHSSCLCLLQPSLALLHCHLATACCLCRSDSPGPGSVKQLCLLTQPPTPGAPQLHTVIFKSVSCIMCLCLRRPGNSCDDQLKSCPKLRSTGAMPAGSKCCHFPCCPCNSPVCPAHGPMPQRAAPFAKDSRPPPDADPSVQK